MNGVTRSEAAHRAIIAGLPAVAEADMGAGWVSIPTSAVAALEQIAAHQGTTRTKAVELAIVRMAAALTPSRPPTLEEARDIAGAFARLANTIAEALSDEDLADAPPADEMLVLEAA
jgi:hypothetical protein